MTCCSRCSRSAKRAPHSVATHYVLHSTPSWNFTPSTIFASHSNPRSRRQLRSSHRPSCRSSRAHHVRAADVDHPCAVGLASSACFVEFFIAVATTSNVCCALRPVIPDASFLRHEWPKVAVLCHTQSVVLSPSNQYFVQFLAPGTKCF